MVGGMCFSIEADIVTGVVVTAVGIDAIRHVGHNRETAMAALPVIFGLHQLIEVFVWKGLDGRASATVAQGAAWLYLLIAFGSDARSTHLFEEGLSGVLASELSQCQSPEEQSEVAEGNIPETAGDDQGDNDHSQPGGDHVGEDLGTKPDADSSRDLNDPDDGHHC